jgi:ACS family tartrate transporter-like MFS transporter
MAMMFVVGPWSFYTLRFLLGAAEAGFFPGIIYYFTLWFPARERARAVAQFTTASMAAGVVGGPISGLLLSLDGVGGLSGWQWLFLIEGLPAVVLGVITLRYLTDRPETAHWLAADEQAWLVEALRREGDSAHAHASWSSGLRHPAIWQYALAMFLIVTSGYGFSFFLPQIVRSLSGGSVLLVGLLTALPFSAAAAAMIVVAARSDRTGERRWYVAACAAVAAAGLLWSTLMTSPALALFALCVAATGLYSYTPVFWSLPTALLQGSAAAAGVAFINSVGNLGGFVGPYLMGWLQDVSGDFLTGLRVLAGVAILSGVLILVINRQRVVLTTRVEPT